MNGCSTQRSSLNVPPGDLYKHYIHFKKLTILVFVYVHQVTVISLNHVRTRQNKIF